MTVLRVIDGGGGRMWHVTVTVAGEPVLESEIKCALERLSEEHPFLLAGRYATDRAEVRYWDEAPDAATVADLASRLWDEHAASAALPAWEVVGVEVIDRETFHQRARSASLRPDLLSAGRALPFGGREGRSEPARDGAPR